MKRAPAVMLHKLNGRLLTFRVGEDFAYKISGVTYVKVGGGKEYAIKETLDELDTLIQEAKL